MELNQEINIQITEENLIFRNFQLSILVIIYSLLKNIILLNKIFHLFCIAQKPTVCLTKIIKNNSTSIMGSSTQNNTEMMKILIIII